jgi:glycosyltransferase involved in cell wall biosynthesis
MRRWDVRTAANPHRFIAISHHVRQRIKAIYGRESDLIYPPVDTSRFTLSTRDEGWFLIVSALVPYKRIDLAVRVCSKLGERLTIVGDGPEFGRLRAEAGPTVQFTGWLPDRDVNDLYASCTAVLFPGEEDFGIVPLEAMASGKPVVAFAKGGALETVIEDRDVRTGVLFGEQTEQALARAIREVREVSFDRSALRQFSLGFDREVYKAKTLDYVGARWAEFLEGSLQP